jgi:hypothetical protein
VNRGSLNGTEVAIYRNPTPACGTTDDLFLSPGTCRTTQCGICVTGAPTFYDCAGGCPVCAGSQSCNRVIAGYMLSPTIAP